MAPWEVGLSLLKYPVILLILLILLRKFSNIFESLLIIISSDLHFYFRTFVCSLYQVMDSDKCSANSTLNDFSFVFILSTIVFFSSEKILSSGLGNCIACKSLAIQTLLWILELVMQDQNLKHDTIAEIILFCKIKKKLFYYIINKLIVFKYWSTVSNSRWETRFSESRETKGL